MASVQCNNSNPLIWLQAFCLIIPPHTWSLQTKQTIVPYLRRGSMGRLCRYKSVLACSENSNIWYQKSLFNSRGCYHLCLLYHFWETAAGCNEHLGTGTESTESLNIMLLKAWYGFFSVFRFWVEQECCNSILHTGGLGNIQRGEFHSLKPVWNRQRTSGFYISIYPT